MGCKVASTRVWRQWIHSRYHTIEGIDSLAGLTNVYFDTGAICEAGAIHACIKAFGRLSLGINANNALSINCQSAIFQNLVVGNHRNYPSAVD